jgi:hypothetical protein
VFTQTMFHLLTPSHGYDWSPSSQPAYITSLMPSKLDQVITPPICIWEMPNQITTRILPILTGGFCSYPQDLLVMTPLNRPQLLLSISLPINVQSDVHPFKAS